jgi:hypothetical protein
MDKESPKPKDQCCSWHNLNLTFMNITAMNFYIKLDFQSIILECRMCLQTKSSLEQVIVFYMYSCKKGSSI